MVCHVNGKVPHPYWQLKGDLTSTFTAQPYLSPTISYTLSFVLLAAERESVFMSRFSCGYSTNYLPHSFYFYDWNQYTVLAEAPHT